MSDTGSHQTDIINQYHEELREALKAKAAAESENAKLREAMTKAIESMTATQYTLGVVRPDIEKIQGPDWENVYEALTCEYELLQEALSDQSSTVDREKL